MRKSILMTLGLMLGLVGLVSALDRQAEITGASNYKNLNYTTTQTSMFTGDGLLEGIVVSSASLATSPYVVFLDTGSTGISGDELTRVYITSYVVLGGAASFSASGDTITNFMVKFPTPIRVNKGLSATQSGVGFKSTILYKKFN